MRKNIYIFTVCLFLIFPAVLSAQTAKRIEQLLQTKSVNYDQAARFVLEAADIIDLPSDSAFSYAMKQKWLPKAAAEDMEIRLNEVSLLIMRSFGIKGGLLYTLFKTPHYAYRELVHRDVIQGRTDPEMTVSGETLLFIIDRAFTVYEDKPWDTSFVQEEIPTQDILVQETLVQEINTQIEHLEVRDASVRVTDEGITISLFNVSFLADSAELSDEGKKEFEDIAQILNTIPSRNIMVSGHTAMAGTEEGRRQLSLERAQSIKDFLVSQNVRTADEITVFGYGAERPLADNNTPEGMILNRRVEITILRQQ